MGQTEIKLLRRRH